MTLDPQPINNNSVTTLGTYFAMITFITLLKSRSQSLSSKDEQTLRDIILSKSKPGIVHF